MANGNGLYELEIISQAPTRISLAGGGTNVSPYPEQFGGEVVNATISIFMLARLRLSRDPTVIIHANTRPQPMVYPSFKDMAFDGQLDFIKAAAQAMYDGRGGFELFVYSSLPMRSGLGGSGAMCMAVLGAFNAVRHGRKLNHYDLAELAYEIETVQLGNASGRQDQYAAAFGGFNHFEFLGGNHVRARPVDIGRAGERILNQALLLFWLGERKASGGIIEDQRAAMKNGGSTLEAFHASKKRVAEMHEALQRRGCRADRPPAASPLAGEKTIQQGHLQSGDRRDLRAARRCGDDRRQDRRRRRRRAHRGLLPHREARLGAGGGGGTQNTQRAVLLRPGGPDQLAGAASDRRLRAR